MADIPEHISNAATQALWRDVMPDQESTDTELSNARQVANTVLAAALPHIAADPTTHTDAARADERRKVIDMLERAADICRDPHDAETLRHAALMVEGMSA